MVAEIVAVAGKGIVVFVGVVEKLLWVVVVVVVTEEDSMYSLSTDLLVYNLVAAVVRMRRISDLERMLGQTYLHLK